MEAFRLRRLLTEQDGFALATVMMVMAIALGFASVAAVASIDSLRGTVRDEDSKTALGAADAGARIAVTRQNTAAGSGATPCLTPGAGGQLQMSAPQTDGWCAPVTGSIDEATYSYQTKVDEVAETLTVVSTGSSDGVDRRVEVFAPRLTGSGIFSQAGVIGLDSIGMDSNAKVYSGAASDGSITMKSNSVLCGSASVGIGDQLILAGNAKHGGSPPCPQSSYGTNQEQLILPPVQQGDVPVNNSNGRFFTQDLIGGKASGVIWDPATRSLELKSNVSLTLGGSNYSLCSLKLGSNSSLFIAAGATVRIFFDSPENCNQPGGVTQLDMSSNSQIAATSDAPVDVALLFVGSDTLETRIQLNSNIQANQACNSEFVIYAPKSTIDFNSNVTYCGAVAGKSVQLDSNVKVVASEGLNDWELPGAGPHYVPERFVECRTEVGAFPNDGC